VSATSSADRRRGTTGLAAYPRPKVSVIQRLARQGAVETRRGRPGQRGAAGVIDTPLVANRAPRIHRERAPQHSDGRVGLPEEVAAAIRFLILPPRPGSITVHVLPVERGTAFAQACPPCERHTDAWAGVPAESR